MKTTGNQKQVPTDTKQVPINTHDHPGPTSLCLSLPLSLSPSLLPSLPPSCLSLSLLNESCPDTPDTGTPPGRRAA